MKILITGATGFIGQSLTSSLLGKGHTIHYLTTQAKKIKDSTRYHGFLWNPAKKEIDLKALESVDVIIHLAGASISGSWSDKGKQDILQSRLDSSFLLYQTLEQMDHQVKTIVCASAIGIYPDLGATWQSEQEQKKAPNFLGNVVDQWEAANTRFKDLGIGVCLIRIGLVLSKNAGALPEFIKPIRFGFGTVLGSGKQYYSWIHIQDITRMFVFAAQEGLTGIYNGVAQDPKTNKEFVKILAAKMNRFIWPIAVPSFLIQVPLGEKHILVTYGQRVSNEKIIEKGFEFKYSSLEKALSDVLRNT